MGRVVIGTIGDQKIQGQGLGIDDSGAYRVRDDCGRTHRLISGEVRLRRVADGANIESSCQDQSVPCLSIDKSMIERVLSTNCFFDIEDL